MPGERKDHARTQQGGGRLQAKRRGLRGSQLCRHLDLGLLASKTETQMPVVKPPRPRRFVMAAWEMGMSGLQQLSDAEAFLQMKSNVRKPEI